LFRDAAKKNFANMALELCVRPVGEPNREMINALHSAVELLGDLCPTPAVNHCVPFGAAEIEIIEIRE
jgi:hypothetical protein